MNSRNSSTVAAVVFYSIASALSLLGLFMFVQYLFNPQGSVMMRVHARQGWPAVAFPLVVLMPVFLFGARAFVRQGDRRR